MRNALLLLLALIIPVQAENKATAEWIPESATASPGQPFRTVIRLTVDEGWHTYWENPGEGGLPIKATAELPEGWSLEAIQFPTPVSFMTGPLHGYGYKGEVLFALTVAPPAGLKEETPTTAFTAALTWLTCNDKSCVPGKSQLNLSPADPDLVAKAYDALPKAIAGATLTLHPKADLIKITLTFPTDWKEDPTIYQILPATRNILTPDAKPALTKHPTKENTWIAAAPKNEYFTTLPGTTTIILVPPTGSTWKISTAP